MEEEELIEGEIYHAEIENMFWLFRFNTTPKKRPRLPFNTDKSHRSNYNTTLYLGNSTTIRESTKLEKLHFLINEALFLCTGGYQESWSIKIPDGYVEDLTGTHVELQSTTHFNYKFIADVNNVTFNPQEKVIADDIVDKVLRKVFPEVVRSQLVEKEKEKEKVVLPEEYGLRLKDLVEGEIYCIKGSYKWTFRHHKYQDRRNQIFYRDSGSGFSTELNLDSKCKFRHATLSEKFKFIAAEYSKEFYKTFSLKVSDHFKPVLKNLLGPMGVGSKLVSSLSGGEHLTYNVGKMDKQYNQEASNIIIRNFISECKIPIPEEKSVEPWSKGTWVVQIKGPDIGRSEEIIRDLDGKIAWFEDFKSYRIDNGEKYNNGVVYKWFPTFEKAAKHSESIKLSKGASSALDEELTKKVEESPKPIVNPTFDELPKWIQEKMLVNQVKQGNKLDPNKFRERLSKGANHGGFTWSETIEGHSYWSNILISGVFPEKPQPNSKHKSESALDLRIPDTVTKFQELLSESETSIHYGWPTQDYPEPLSSATVEEQRELIKKQHQEELAPIFDVEKSRAVIKIKLH